ncbi:FAD binding domain-containing protein [Halorubrum vacuolatum]|uniref:Carbon-monoxide dehydrogenase medium subunit n=1 Tax=Halorubrum vacuolatum TaxID=63740 RepID=A0A238XC50_HALVU|nr:xanthine dehydrogenase family protein subunit M [Halorubrum vacuolatum]SNR56138.1 carbon-monoxide dehydrogenase medium subunit [Halorubrum vacuolatum]
MYAPEFEYRRAESVEHALELLAAHEDARPIAGAHGLLPRLRTGEESASVLVDIGHLDGLTGIDERDDTIRIGALTTHAEIAGSDPVREHAGAMADAASELGDPQVRNGATIGGNLAHGDARADLPAAFLALDGELVVRGVDGDRTVPATDLFKGHFRTVVAPHELITEVRLPIEDESTSAYVKRRNPLSGYALVGVSACLGFAVTDDDARTVETARVAVTGATTKPSRLPGVEAALAGMTVDGEAGRLDETDRLTGAAARATEGFEADDYRADSQTSPEYLAHLLPVYTEQALHRAVEGYRRSR